MFDEPESLRSFYERSLCEQYNPFSRFCQRPFRNSIEKFPLVMKKYLVIFTGIWYNQEYIQVIL